MSESWRQIAVCLTTLGVLWAAGNRDCGAAEARSIQELMQQKSSWPTFVQGQVLLRVEGRCSSISRNRLQFRECDLPFLPEKGTTFARLNGRSMNIEVSGVLHKRQRDYVFIVKEMLELTSDLDIYRQKRAQIALDQAEELYALGDWATQRSKFYGDEELLAAARDSYLKGISAERRRLAEDDHEGLMALAEKVNQYGLGAPVAQEFVHEAIQRRWRTVRDLPPKKLREFAGEMAEQLPGSDDPLTPPQPKLRTRYWDNPLAVYAKAGEVERRKLHRMFASTVLLESIVREADPAGADGFEIAARIDELVPERHALAEQYREKALELKFSQLETSTRRDAIELSELFRTRDRPEKARVTLERWVAAKERALRQEGPAGLMQLAKEYRNLLEDQETAVKLLVEAYRVSPETGEIVEELNRLGYRLKDGRWITGFDGDAGPTDPIRQAMREGRVVVGMTSQQVRKALGTPNSVTRVASQGQLNEVWAYGTAGGTRLVVHFIRGVRQENSEVVAVSQLKQR